MEDLDPILGAVAAQSMQPTLTWTGSRIVRPGRDQTHAAAGSTIGGVARDSCSRG